MLMNGQELVQSLRNTVQEISVQKLQEIMQKNPQGLLIDIREKQETDAGSASNAILISRGVLEMQINNHSSIVERLDPEQELAQQPIYLMCRSGARSVLSAVSLQQMGFKNVYSIAGGFLAWQAAGYSCNEPA